MKAKYIKVAEITDIDTSKVSVYDLNNRYIDKNGKMFGLKYNPGSRKIEIIRIVRAADREVGDMQQKIMKKRFSDFDSHSPVDEKNHESAENQETQEQERFEPEAFINDCSKLMQTHRLRLKGVIMNIKNSNIFPKENKHESNVLENVFRNIEIDGERGFDHVDNYQKELQGYPRSIIYYQAKIDNKGNAIIEGLGGDNEKIMRFIYIFEMYTSFNHLFTNLLKMVKDLQEMMEEKNMDDMKNIPHLEKQSFLDAKTSINNTISEIEDILERMKKLEHYVYNPDNF